jgi:hypothetical protein
MAKEEKPIYHCDMYYYDNVCTSRGKLDIADVRYSKDGWRKEERSLCTTFGLSPFFDGLPLCSHCMEYKNLFRHEPQTHSSKITKLM